MSTKPAAPINGNSELDDLRADVRALRDDLKAVMADLKESAAARGEKAIKKSKQFVSHTGDQLGDAGHAIEDSVRNNPLGAVGASFAAGLLIATLRGK